MVDGKPAPSAKSLNDRLAALGGMTAAAASYMPGSDSSDDEYGLGLTGEEADLVEQTMAQLRLERALPAQASARHGAGGGGGTSRASDDAGGGGSAATCGGSVTMADDAALARAQAASARRDAAQLSSELAGHKDLESYTAAGYDQRVFVCHQQ